MYLHIRSVMRDGLWGGVGDLRKLWKNTKIGFFSWEYNGKEVVMTTLQYMSESQIGHYPHLETNRRQTDHKEQHMHTHVQVLEC